jgi:hypothetical protein
VTAAPPQDEAGFASLALPVLLWVVTLAAVALVDVAAYLVAASRAQSLADAAALAAVTVDAAAPARGSPRGRASIVVRAGDGRLERCGCRAGTGRASAEVSVPVPGLVLPRIGAARVIASAEAALAPPDGSPRSTPRRAAERPARAALRTPLYPVLHLSRLPVVVVGDRPERPP